MDVQSIVVGRGVDWNRDPIKSGINIIASCCVIDHHVSCMK